MFTEKLSFNDMPEAMAYLINKVEKLEALLTNNSKSDNTTESDKRFNIQELCSYLPDRPARQTVYGWIGQRLIPYHKKGKKLQFLKSEIDNWLKADKRQTLDELQAEAEEAFNCKKRRAQL